MSHFENNLNVLRRVDSALAQKLRNHFTKGIHLSADKDADAQVNVKIGEHWLYPSQLALSLSEFQQRIAQVDSPSILIFMGIGLGYHLKTYLQQPHPLNEYIVIVEPDLDLFCLFLSLGDYGEILSHHRISWIVGTEEDKLMSQLNTIAQKPQFAICIEQALFVEWGYQHPFFERFRYYWNRFLNVIKMETRAHPIDAYVGLVNFFDNWNSVTSVPFLEGFKGLFENRPGVIVGTGPSLEHSWEFLEKIQDKAVLFSVDSACRLLQDKKINFTLTGTLEREAATEKLFQDVDTEGKVFVSTPIVHPKTFARFKDHQIHLVRPHHFLPWLYPQSQVPVVGMNSVTHLGLYTLYHLGCHPIYLVGQDLAFDPHNQESHTSGYEDNITFDADTASETVGWNCFKVTANDGGEILSDDTWVQFAELITQLIDRFNIDAYNVIPKNYGMRIDGTKRLDPSDAIKAFTEKVDVKAVLSDHFEKVVGPDKSAVHSRVEETKVWLQEIIDESHQTLCEINQLYNDYGSDLEQADRSCYYHLFRKLEDQSNRLHDDAFFQNLLRPIVQAHHIRLIMVSRTLLALKDDNQILFEKLSLLSCWYSEMIVMSRLILNKLNKI